MKKVLFIDRDGTLVIEPPIDYQLDSLEKLEFYPAVFQYLSKIASELDYTLVMVTNQDGLGTEAFPMLQSYIYGDYDLDNSFVIGDRNSDMQLAINLNANGIFIGESNSLAVLSTKSWKEIYQFLKNKPRTASVKRKTKETDIQVALNLDGQGVTEINTGIGFYDHMLEQIARHGNLDLSLVIKGDLEIDEHHSIEDSALALGQAFKEALGNKKGIERYGYLLPMDDCLAQVAIDFGGRPWLVWDANFKREKIGEMPTEMFMHFFKSFSDTAKCNLNIKAEGTNEHHKIESIFKAFAKSIKMAKQKTDNYSVPSTKGVL